MPSKAEGRRSIPLGGRGAGGKVLMACPPGGGPKSFRSKDLALIQITLIDVVQIREVARTARAGDDAGTARRRPHAGRRRLRPLSIRGAPGVSLAHAGVRSRDAPRIPRVRSALVTARPTRDIR